MTGSPRSKVLAALHRSRMRPYLAETGGSERAALSLYRWHLDLTASVSTVLGLTEVVLRNAMDARLQAWNGAQAGQEGRSWLLHEPATPLRALTAHKRRDALERATKEARRRDKTHWRYGEPVSHDDVLAQVMFGMWKDLLPNHLPSAGVNQANKNRARMWQEALRGAFPHVDDPDGEVTFWRVAHLHLLRNRVSHLEPLLRVDVARLTSEAFDLVGSIDPDVRDWVTGSSRVAAVLKQRPGR